MRPHTNAKIKGRNGQQGGVWTPVFLPDLQALKDRLDDIFQQYAVQRARHLRMQLMTEALDHLTDCEVLQLVLDPVCGGRKTKPLSQALLRKFRTFGRVVNAPFSELMAIDGIGEMGAAALRTVGAAAVHMLRKEVSAQPIFTGSNALKAYLTAKLQHQRVEVFFALYLDRSNRLIECEELWRGTVDRMFVCPREVMRRCVQLDATAIFIVHNHPSGNPQASVQDIEFTSAVVRAASVLDVTVLDSIIVGNGETFSMRDNNLL